MISLQKLSTFFLFLFIVLSGCIDTAIPKIGSPDIQVSNPYNLNPNTIAFRIDTAISVPIENTRKGEIKIELTKAELVANMKDDIKEHVYGSSIPIFINPNQITNLSVSFKGVPVVFELKEDPLRLSPLVTSYDITIKYKGTVKIFGFIPFSKTDTYTKIIPLEELLLDKEIFTQIIN